MYFSPEYEHGCGRPSQIWTVSPHAIKAMATKRTKELARHKSVLAGFIHHRPQHMYSCGRCSTIWQTSRPAMTCPNRPHTARLAQPKQLHTDYLSSRQVYTLYILYYPTFPLHATVSIYPTSALRMTWLHFTWPH